jgi:hypothetical protein
MRRNYMRREESHAVRFLFLYDASLLKFLFKKLKMLQKHAVDHSPLLTRRKNTKYLRSIHRKRSIVYEVGPLWVSRA